MNTYIIKIDGQYFAGIGTESFGKSPAGGWYDEGSDIPAVMLSPDRQDAKCIEGNINLKSYFNKIYDCMRYGDFEFAKFEIVKVVKE